ncbi:proline racemase family protein, partial [Klebsiella pneumoniae]|nr:proline racemase family protein [Klebsiella pneumoniae]
RYKKAVEVDVEKYGKVTGDIAWGGNWFFLINDHGQRVSSDNLDQLTEYAWTVRQALTAQGITGKDGQEIDHIELFASDTEADSKNFVL